MSMDTMGVLKVTIKGVATTASDFILWSVVFRYGRDCHMLHR